jgi:polysaccharide export outer membrane protein
LASPAQEAAVRKVALTATSMSDPNSKAYKVGPLDVLEVTVFKVPELSKSVQVSETGTISFPLVGEVAAGGKTAREIEQTLTKLLGSKYLQNPQVTVFVKEYNSQRVTIEGAIKKPGVIPMAGGLSLLQAVAQAQGLETTAETTVVVFRVTNGRRAAAKYDVSSIREGKADDPQLQAGDVIIVPTSDVKEGINTVVKLLPLATLIPLL